VQNDYELQHETSEANLAAVIGKTDGHSSKLWQLHMPNVTMCI
jgi:hypothetical protein